MTCQNCQSEFEDNFCPNCGQRKTANNRLVLKDMIQRFADDQFDFDRGFTYTLWQLATRPGKLARNYLAGKRKRYTAPTRFLIIAVAFQALIDFLSEDRRLIREFEPFFMDMFSDSIQGSVRYWSYIFGTEYALSASVIMIAFFPIAFNLFFRKQGYNYTELLVASFYFFSIAVIYSIFVGFFLRHVFMLYEGELITTIMVAVLCWSFMQFFHEVKLLPRFLKIIGSLLFIVFLRLYLFPFIFALLFPYSSNVL